MDDYVQLIESSYKKALDKVGVEALSAKFFEPFFKRFPETASVFKGTNLEYFSKFKMNVIFNFLIDIVKHPNYAEAFVSQEVMRHQMYGLKDKEYYFNLGSCFQEAVKDTLGDEWTEEMEVAWNDILLAFRGLIGEAVDAYV